MGMMPCLQEIQGGRREYHGKDEVLASKHEDKVHVQCVNGPCKMLTFDEYLQQKTSIDEEMFYTREFYEATAGVIVVLTFTRRCTFSWIF